MAVELHTSAEEEYQAAIRQSLARVFNLYRNVETHQWNVDPQDKDAFLKRRLPVYMDALVRGIDPCFDRLKTEAGISIEIMGGIGKRTYRMKDDTITYTLSPISAGEAHYIHFYEDLEKQYPGEKPELSGICDPWTDPYILSKIVAEGRKVQEKYYSTFVQTRRTLINLQTNANETLRYIGSLQEHARMVETVSQTLHEPHPSGTEAESFIESYVVNNHPILSLSSEIEDQAAKTIKLQQLFLRQGQDGRPVSESVRAQYERTIMVEWLTNPDAFPTLDAIRKPQTTYDRVKAMHAHAFFPHLEVPVTKADLDIYILDFLTKTSPRLRELLRAGDFDENLGLQYIANLLRSRLNDLFEQSQKSNGRTAYAPDENIARLFYRLSAYKPGKVQPALQEVPRSTEVDRIREQIKQQGTISLAAISNLALPDQKTIFMEVMLPENEAAMLKLIDRYKVRLDPRQGILVVSPVGNTIELQKTNFSLFQTFAQLCAQEVERGNEYVIGIFSDRLMTLATLRFLRQSAVPKSTDLRTKVIFFGMYALDTNNPDETYTARRQDLVMYTAALILSLHAKSQEQFRTYSEASVNTHLSNILQTIQNELRAYFTHPTLHEPMDALYPLSSDEIKAFSTDRFQNEVSQMVHTLISQLRRFTLGENPQQKLMDLLTCAAPSEPLDETNYAFRVYAMLTEPGGIYVPFLERLDEETQKSLLLKIFTTDSPQHRQALFRLIRLVGLSYNPKLHVFEQLPLESLEKRWSKKDRYNSFYTVLCSMFVEQLGENNEITRHVLERLVFQTASTQYLHRKFHFSTGSSEKNVRDVLKGIEGEPITSEFANTLIEHATFLAIWKVRSLTTKESYLSLITEEVIADAMDSVFLFINRRVRDRQDFGADFSSFYENIDNTTLRTDIYSNIVRVIGEITESTITGDPYTVLIDMFKTRPVADIPKAPSQSSIFSPPPKQPPADTPISPPQIQPDTEQISSADQKGARPLNTLFPEIELPAKVVEQLADITVQSFGRENLWVSVLMRAGIYTLGDLLKRSKDEIMDIRRMGPINAIHLCEDLEGMLNTFGYPCEPHLLTKKLIATYSKWHGPSYVKRAIEDYLNNKAKLGKTDPLKIKDWYTLLP